MQSRLLDRLVKDYDMFLKYSDYLTRDTSYYGEDLLQETAAYLTEKQPNLEVRAVDPEKAYIMATLRLIWKRERWNYKTKQEKHSIFLEHTDTQELPKIDFELDKEILKKRAVSRLKYFLDESEMRRVKYIISEDTGNVKRYKNGGSDNKRRGMLASKAANIIAQDLSHLAWYY